MKRGDILQKEIVPGEVEFFHVEQVHADGSIDAIADSTGKPAGLNLRRDDLQPATMDDVLAHRRIAATPYMDYEAVNATVEEPTSATLPQSAGGV
jgi:hypothetical protein